MRKLALVAAALMPLLGGCVASTCDLPTVTVHWQLQDTTGTGWTCTQAGVAFVDVYIGSTQPVRFNCTDYAGSIDVSRIAVGTYSTTVEGIASDGVTILDRARPFNVYVGDCGDHSYYPVLGEGLLNIDYHFAPVDACHGGSMWFALYDEVAQNYISAVDPSSTNYWKAYYACYSTSGGTPLEFSVPFGSYTLAWIQEVQNPTTSPNPAWQACVQAPLDVNGSGTTFLPVTLSAYAGTCPAYP
jgi:hypothetical protein